MEKSMLKKLVDWHWKKILIFFLVFMGIFAVFTLVMNSTRVVNPELFDILDLEFAWTSERVEWILASWSMQGVLVQELVITYLDYGWLIGYGGFSFWLLVLGAKGMQDNEKLKQFSISIIPLPLLSAACDAIENYSLINMMGNYPFPPPSSIHAAMASLFATIKFALLGLSLLFFIVEVIIFLKNRKK